MKPNNNVYRFNPFYRYVEFPEFKSDQNAKLPIRDTFSYTLMQDTLGDALVTGKCWDDSEVSDEEMDALLDQMNAMNRVAGEYDSET